MKRVFNDDNDVEKRLLLLSPEVKLDHFSSPSSSNGGGDGIVTAEHVQFMKDNGGEAVDFDLRLGYDNMVVDEVLRKLLPANAEVPSSFEAAGHVAHLNIREEFVEYKRVIGQVILDKNYPQIRTVVNKVGEITNEFRTFPLEVIAGVDDLNVTLRESGANFTFNFAEVYWNSRLQMEHSRIIDLIRKEGGGNGNPAIMADMMAGVGPFAVPLALKAKEDNNPQKHGQRGGGEGGRQQ
jgi:tRNA (guanine37-N1)-methyltransferase